MSSPQANPSHSLVTFVSRSQKPPSTKLWYIGTTVSLFLHLWIDLHVILLWLISRLQINLECRKEKKK
ncbi:hypothetical protein GYMLUDRAFT_922751 [Collybiopsis luxurians FD-317 M1]|uniref:Transmembrane protein n=1 Tax=Collybiopsis luxurians FD-317 M1 TaxID=944289 RepID=A0A0D0BW96_9AGAR|nr:hypothetical protein GYMLUDRAFT_922751 [Collybiopsis luxurians FD-317 M1]